jgi:putative transposase
MPESLEQLDLLLLTVARPRKVQRDGIRFQGLRYLDPLLAAYVGETVTIRYDPRDLTELRVFHQDQFLCRAICQELAGETVSLQDIIKARRLRKRELHEHLRQRRSLLDVMLPAKSSLPETIPAVRKPEKPQKNLKRYRNN